MRITQLGVYTGHQTPRARRRRAARVLSHVLNTRSRNCFLSSKAAQGRAPGTGERVKGFSRNAAHAGCPLGPSRVPPRVPQATTILVSNSSAGPRNLVVKRCRGRETRDKAHSLASYLHAHGPLRGWDCISPSPYVGVLGPGQAYAKTGLGQPCHVPFEVWGQWGLGKLCTLPCRRGPAGVTGRVRVKMRSPGP